MRTSRIDINDIFIKKQTEKSRSLLKKLDLSKKTEDSEIKRKEEHLCQACFYRPAQIVMQAFWKCDCGYCGKEQTFVNSDINYSCLECAKEESVCTKCCADID